MFPWLGLIFECQGYYECYEVQIHFFLINVPIKDWFSDSLNKLLLILKYLKDFHLDFESFTYIWSSCWEFYIFNIRFFFKPRNWFQWALGKMASVWLSLLSSKLLMKWISVQSILHNMLMDWYQKWYQKTWISALINNILGLFLIKRYAFQRRKT